MSTEITMQDLELETAELLPSRETLWSYSHGTSINQFGVGNAVQSANGGSGDGGLISVLNGDAVNINVL